MFDHEESFMSAASRHTITVVQTKKEKKKKGPKELDDDEEFEKAIKVDEQQLYLSSDSDK